MGSTLGKKPAALVVSGQQLADGTVTTNKMAPQSVTTQKLAQDVSDAIANSTPSGAVAFFARNSAPTGWIKANGAAISRTTYAALFTAIGTTFGAGDGSTTFNLPDMRGEFPRGWDDSRGVDSGRAFGSAQGHAFQGHRHEFWIASSVASGFSGSGGRYADGTANMMVDTNGHVRTATTDGTNGTPNIASETRPRNVALLACIKY